MKSLLLLITITITASSSAVVGNAMSYIGTYSEPGQTFVIGYSQEAACLEDNGSWDSEMELCFFDIENTVEVTGDSEGYNIVVATWGSNAHSCVFEGKATQILPKALISEVPTEVYNGDSWEVAVCQVTVTYENDETVTVSTNGKCQEFCGARAWLEMGPAALKN